MSKSLSDKEARQLRYPYPATSLELARAYHRHVSNARSERFRNYYEQLMYYHLLIAAMKGVI